jgi:nucleoside phosphorylase
MLSLADVQGKVDFGVITIRQDEYTMMLGHLSGHKVVNGRRFYEFAEVPTTAQGTVGVAVTRCLEQGNNDSFIAACDLIDELEPAWILVVGIAGGYPDDDFSLGDVLLASRFYDFTVFAAIQEGADHNREWSPAGGPVHQEVEKLLGAIPGWAKTSLKGWNKKTKLGRDRPTCEVPADTTSDRLNGPEKHRDAILKSLRKHFPQGGKPRPPVYSVASVATGNTLVKDPQISAEWKTCARTARFVEMEAGGVYRAARRRQPETPVLVVRGISDIIGLKRDGAWTEFACCSAAAFAVGLMTPSVCNLEQARTRTTPPPAAAGDSPPALDKSELEDEMARLTFAELQVVTKHLARQKPEAGVGFSNIDPDQKIAKNGLTNATRELLVLGLSKVKLVQEYVNTVEKVDPHFPDELTGGFVHAYRTFRTAGLEGDALFRRLADLACYPSNSGQHQAAGLAVLTYLFEQ